MQSNPKWIRTSFCWCLQVDRVNKNARPSLKKVDPHNNTRKIYKNISLVKHGFQVMASWWLKNVQSPPQVSV